MTHRERRDHPEAVPPIPPLIDRGEGEQKEDVVKRLGIDDVVEAEMYEAQEFTHAPVLCVGEARPEGRGPGPAGTGPNKD
jgi:hypothetical protein